ncbi:MAG: hypothetical protein R2741_13325 [Methanolobus sp.]
MINFKENGRCDVGASLSKNIVSNDMNGILEEMMSFWKEHDIGSFTIACSEPLKLDITTFLIVVQFTSRKKHFLLFCPGV